MQAAGAERRPPRCVSVLDNHNNPPPLLGSVLLTLDIPRKEVGLLCR